MHDEGQVSLADARQYAHELTKAITKLVLDFEDRTGCPVVSINVHRVSVISIERTRLTHIDCDVSL